MYHSVGDRFIPRRHSRSHPYGSPTYDNAASGMDILSQRASDGFRRAHGSRLENIWGMKSVHERIFRFSNTKHFGKPQVETGFIAKVHDWPRKPRKKPCITTPDMILDLPEFAGSFYQNLLDWGPNGRFAAALKEFVYLWNAETRSTNILTKFVNAVGTVVKWNFKGNLLAVGNNISLIQVWDIAVEKVEFEAWCGCDSKCDINTIDWHPAGSMLVSGCSNGTLCQMNRTNNALIKKVLRAAHVGKIARVLTSPDGKYLASCGEDGYVRLWLWTKFKFMFQIDLHLPCRSLAWHPWQPAILAMGAVSISVWNVKKKTLQAWHAPQQAAAIYAITFSSITGEMVVSARVLTPVANVEAPSRPVDNGNTGANSQDRLHYESQIMVLGSLDLVVDWLKSDINPSLATFYLLWSPDGKKIATAGSGDTLLIWNFLGEEIKEKSAKQVRSILRDAGNVNNHGFCIR